MSNSVLTIVGKARVVRTEALDYYFIGPCYSVIAPVGSHDDDTLMLLHFCEEHVDVVAAVLLPVLKDGLTLIKEQQSIMDLGLPAYPSNMLCADLCQRVRCHGMSCLCFQARMVDESQLASTARP